MDSYCPVYVVFLIVTGAGNTLRSDRESARTGS